MFHLNPIIMSLLKKYAATVSANANPRETVYGKVFSAVPAAPYVDPTTNDAKPRITVTVQFDGEEHPRNLWAFADQTRGIPAFIPAGGMTCMAVIQESKPDATGKQYLNLAYLGVGA